MAVLLPGGHPGRAYPGCGDDKARDEAATDEEVGDYQDVHRTSSGIAEM
jgi:hypothetical protein